MARFNFLQVYDTMEWGGVVPVFYHSDAETVCSVIKACYDGGVRMFEFTNRGDHAHEVFTQVEKWAIKECPNMVLGVGSVIDAPTAAMYIQSGASFIVGPLFNNDVAKVCNRRNVPYVPGCMTPTEISTAHEAGCHVVKIFPGGNAGGPSFVKNVKAPMPWTKIMVTGGVEPTKESITAWLSAGASAVGMGSNLFPKKIVEAGEWGEITKVCLEVTEIISGIKHGNK